MHTPKFDTHLQASQADFDSMLGARSKPRIKHINGCDSESEAELDFNPAFGAYLGSACPGTWLEAWWGSRA